MKIKGLRLWLMAAAGAFAATCNADALHLDALPYDNSEGWSLESSSWSNKVVVHPKAFKDANGDFVFDTTNYNYHLEVKSTYVQVGYAKWDANYTTETWLDQEWYKEGTYNVDLDSELIGKITRSDETDAYCIQFNYSSGRLYYIHLVAEAKESGGDEGETEATDFSSTLHTEGTRIVDGKGNEFVMRGMNLAWTNFSWSIKSAADWGCNAVRLNFYRTGEGSWLGDNNNGADYLESYIQTCEANKMIAVLCPQDGTCQNDGGYIEGAVDYWKGKKDVLNAHAGTTVLNISNEWYNLGDDTQSQSEIDAAAKVWSEKYVWAVTELRKAGIKNLILIDVAGCGQGAAVLNSRDSEGNLYAQNIIDADAAANGGTANVAFSIHMYHLSGRSGEIARRNLDYCLNLNVPCVLGEFAFEHKAHKEYPVGGPVAWVDVQNYCREKNISWLAWSWSGNGGDAETCDMFYSDGSLQENGKCMFYGPQGIKRNATPCTVYTSETRSGLAYQYPEYASDLELHMGNGGRGYTGESDDSSVEYEETSLTARAVETEGSEWAHYYTVSASAFGGCDFTDGKLRIKIGDSGQTAAYINYLLQDSGWDHNGNSDAHIVGDLHDGQYNYNDLSGDLTKTVKLSSYTDLASYGLRVDANGCTLKELTYLAPKAQEGEEEEETTPESVTVASNCNRDINYSDYYIPSTNFDNVKSGQHLIVVAEISAPTSARKRAATDSNVSLYTSENNGWTKSYLQKNAEEINGADFTAVSGTTAKYVYTPSDADLAELKSKGLYVGGQNFILRSVEASSKSVTTGVEGITSEPEQTGAAEYYTISGMRVRSEQLEPGLYIVRKGNTTRKVLVK